MLARIQRLMIAALLGSAAAWAICMYDAGERGWAAGGSLLIVLSYVVVLALEFFALRLTPAKIDRATSWQLFRAFCGEVAVVPRVFFWRQPFRAGVQPDHLPVSPRSARGVVLVHGFVCNRGLWTPWMHRLRVEQVPFVAVNLEPVFGSIDDYPAIIDAAVSRLESLTGKPPVIVGHSMGGLAIRAWLQSFNADHRAHRIVTIGSPHRGTWLARLSVARNAVQMRLNSTWLRQLAAAEPPTRYARFTCFYGHCDNIAFPAETGTLPGADNRHIAGTAHVNLAFHADVYNEVSRWLASSAARPH